MTKQKPLLIALTGFAGAGKSSAASILSKQHGFKVQKFAGPLKDMLSALGLSYEELEGEAKFKPCYKLSGVTPRYAMQTLGTEWGRHCIHQDLWANLAAINIVRDLQEGFHVVVDDMRFLNESKVIRHLGGFAVRIMRPDATLGCESGHVSETEQLAIIPDHHILNNATKAELTVAIDELVRKLTEAAHV